MAGQDPRIARTLKRLSDALVELADEVGYEAIQVGELVKRARISKSTFYRHFRDKDHLLGHVLAGLLEDIVASIASASSQAEEAVLAFQCVRDRPKGLRLYLSLPAYSLPRQTLRFAWANLVWARYEPLSTQAHLKDMAIKTMMASTEALLEWYGDNMDTVTAKEVASIYLDVIIKATAEVALQPREDWLRGLD